MDKFKYIRVKQSSGEYGTSIPIAVDWSNVDNKPITVDSNGVIDIANIPKAALERLIIVADDTARFALTTATVQTGDTVKVTSTGQMYYIIDDTKLNVEAGYVQYSAGTAASVPWSGVSDKPTTISGYGITDAYTKTQTNNLLNNKVDKISGKGLSTNDYTTTEKNKLAGIAAGAEVNVNPDWNATSGDAAILNKPTTVDGYGITDAYTKSDIDDIVDTSDNTSEAENPLVIETDAAQYAKKTHLTLEPVQDLHGYDHPWAGGAGKNLLNTSAFTEGTYKGITIKIQNDGSLLCNGTVTEPGGVVLGSAVLESGAYAFTGTTSGSTDGTFYLNFSGLVNVSTIERTYTVSGTTETVCTLQLTSGYQMNNVVIKPMIRKSTDSADFAPYSNICPISGLDEVKVKATGENIWDEEYTASGQLVSKNPIKVIPNKTYYFKSSAWAALNFYDKNDVLIDHQVNFAAEHEFTVPSGTAYMHFIVNAEYGTTYNHDISINYPSTDHDYHPYQGTEVSVDLPEPVYSGTLNLETGELRVDKGIVTFNGTETGWVRTYSKTFYIALHSLKKLHDYSNAIKCDRLPTSARQTAFSTNYAISGYNDVSDTYVNQNWIYVLNMMTDSVTELLTWLASNPLQVTYELATPITYQLTPQQLALFKGINNVSTNAKTVQVTYRNGELATTGDIVASTEVAKQSAIGESASYTDAKLATELASILGNFATIEQPIATTNHSIGQLIVIDDSLRKITNTVAAGETFDSSNSSVTNVAAEFASVNILINKITPNATAGAHNGIYRGQDITQYFNDGSLWKRINGTNGYTLFEDLYIGDYITVGGRSYAIVDFDYYIRCGSQDLNQHHLVMMPTGLMNIPEGTVLYNPDTSATPETLLFINNTNASAAAGEEVTVQYQESANYFKWNATMLDPNTHTTNGGYKYSRMRTVIMRAADTLVVNAFGTDHVKPITVLYHNPSSASASGLANTWAWFDKNDWTDPMRKSICDLPNETQVYGQQVWGRGSAYTNMGYEVGIDKWQFAIFALQRNFANIRAYWWLRSVGSVTLAAIVSSFGAATSYGSAGSFGVRPRFVLIG